MKKPEKHIEEIKKIIDDRCEAELGQVHANSKDGKVTKTVDTKLIAKDIYEYLNKDSVVLSREEYEKSLQEKYERGKFDIQCDLEKHDKYLLTKRKYNEIMREGQCITDLIIKAKKQGSNETAEKIIRETIDKLIARKAIVKSFYSISESVGIDMAIDEVKKLAKSLGVEIKE